MTIFSRGRQRRFYRAAGQIETSLPQQTKPVAQQRVCVPFEIENERNRQSPPAGGLCLFRLFAMRKKDFRFVSRKRDSKNKFQTVGEKSSQQNPSMFSPFAMLYDYRFDMTAQIQQAAYGTNLFVHKSRLILACKPVQQTLHFRSQPI